MEQENNPNQSSILIVDDNVKNLQVLGGFLQIEGWMVEFALDGVSALKWLEKRKFDLILLDIMMPVMDGYEVCSIIKNNPAIRDIPLIFITAKTDSETAASFVAPLPLERIPSFRMVCVIPRFSFFIK